MKIQILEDDVIRRDVRARLLVPNDDESSRGALLRTKKARQLSCCLGEASEAASLCKHQLNQTERNGRRSTEGFSSKCLKITVKVAFKITSERLDFEWTKVH